MTVRGDSIAKTDPDFSAVFAAVSLILNRQKPKKQEKMYRLLIGSVTGLAPATALPHQARAVACLREALMRWRDIQ